MQIFHSTSNIGMQQKLQLNLKNQLQDVSNAGVNNNPLKPPILSSDTCCLCLKGSVGKAKECPRWLRTVSDVLQTWHKKSVYVQD